MARTRDQVTDAEVRLPGAAVDPAGDDVGDPAVLLLQKLYLLGTKEELQASDGFSGVFGRTPQSVALIESTGTAMAKWWATGLGAAAAAAWPVVSHFWADAGPAVQRMLILGVSIALAAAVLAIGTIISSDVRGRAAAAVATIEARSLVARAVMDHAEELAGHRSSQSGGAADTATPTPDPVVALPSAVAAKLVSEPAAREGGWQAVATTGRGTGTQVLLVKGTESRWAPLGEVDFG